jgi:DNA-directed RNA polymerase subunit RPC12/RpoP
VDAPGEIMIYECVICGAQFGLSVNSKSEVERIVMLPPVGKCA